MPKTFLDYVGVSLGVMGLYLIVLAWGAAIGPNDFPFGIIFAALGTAAIGVLGLGTILHHIGKIDF